MNCIDFDPSYRTGYASGQRLARQNAHLSEQELSGLALKRFLFFSDTSGLVRPMFQAGFLSGYTDEVNGIAHPLSPFNLPYKRQEVTF